MLSVLQSMHPIEHPIRLR